MVVFATIFGVGFVILLLNLIFGSDHGGDFDTDSSDGFDADAGPSVLSLRMAALLLVGFGAFGFGMRATTEASMFTCSMVGVGGALMVAVMGYIILRAFYTSQASSTITDRDVIGINGNLIDAIPEHGQGQVACTVRGREITFVARSSNGAAIGRGIPVRVISKSGSVVTVVPVK